MDRHSVIAVFDFDETIVLENSLSLLFRHITGNRRYVFKAVPAIVRYLFKPGSYYELRKLIKRRLYHSCVSNQTIDVLRQAGPFAAENLTLNPAVVSRLKKHHTQGDFVLIATASPWQYVQSILEALDIPFDRVIGTTLAFSTEGPLTEGKNVLSGLIQGDECSREHKWQLIKACFKDQEITNSIVIAYGNRPDDVQMLQQADTGYVVSGQNISLFS